jgi:hypothetical protein
LTVDTFTVLESFNSLIWEFAILVAITATIEIKSVFIEFRGLILFFKNKKRELVIPYPIKTKI